MAITTTKASMDYMNNKKKFFMMLLASSEDTDYLYTLDENNNAILIMYRGSNTVIKTPRKINGYRVKGIMSTCYSYNTNITSITIRPGVEIIE